MAWTCEYDSTDVRQPTNRRRLGTQINQPVDPLIDGGDLGREHALLVRRALPVMARRCYGSTVK